MSDRITAPFPTAVESPKAETCEHCHWWVRFGSVLGNCHRMPPTDKGFAVVHDSSFCGEFKAKT